MSYQLSLGVRVRLLAAVMGFASLVWGGGPELDRARKLYQSTDYAQSLKILQAIPVKDAAVYALMGRNYYMQSDYKKATDCLDKAFAAEPSNSDYALWLGRAYGRRAETSSVFTAAGNASKARQYFEKSVALNPKNLEALNDLFEYYLEAPGFLGGGYDKASATAARIAGLDAAEGHWADYKLAEKKKEYRSAEEHLQRAIENAPQQVGRLIDLARFLSSQGRYQEAEQNFAKAEKMAPQSPKLLYNRAEVYVQSGRNLDVARELLKRYMTLNLTADDPPRSDAAKLLRRASGV